MTNPQTAGHSDTHTPGFQLTLTRAMLETLELQKVLYVILSGITAGDGLNFNRAFLFLSDAGRRTLQGRLAIGPKTAEEAHRIWEEMANKRFTLEVLMERYEAFKRDENASALSRQIVKLSFTLPPTPAPNDSFLDTLYQVWSQKTPLIINENTVTLTRTPIVLEKIAFIPLVVGEDPIGVLVCDNAYNKTPITDQKKEEALSLANLAAIAVERARLHEKIRKMADLDGLTRLVNRRRFEEVFARLFAEAREYNHDLAILLVDLDHFKNINDTHGHLAGDDVLKGVASIIQDRVRSGDVAARYGGDELIVLLPRADRLQATEVGKEIKSQITKARFGPQKNIPCSVSIGIASLRQEHKTPKNLVEEADKALYSAKTTGRNSVVTSTV